MGRQVPRTGGGPPQDVSRLRLGTSWVLGIRWPKLGERGARAWPLSWKSGLPRRQMPPWLSIPAHVQLCQDAPEPESPNHLRRTVLSLR